ncbi:MAG TPA: DUF3828 domain-containing protein [Caulobacteraceae bacterium]
MLGRAMNSPQFCAREGVGVVTVIAIGVMLGLSAPAAAAPTASDPGALVRKLYADEVVFHPHGYPLWWGALTGRAHALMGRVLKVQKASGDELIDSDFLCQCQDSGGLRITSLSVAKSSPTRATVSVRFNYGGGSGGNSVRLDLVNEGGWKVANITNRQGETLTGTLEAALKPYPNR